MNVPAEIFKAYDIRGVVDKALTAEVVQSIGRAIGSEALSHNQTAVIVGRDGRLSGPRLQDALATGITATGCNVIDIGQAPTPVVYYAGHQLGTQSAVAITGSHNPPEYNGLKIVINGATLSGDHIQALRQRIVDGNFRAGSGRRTHSSVTDAYLRRIVDDVRPERSLKLVIDCGNGVAGAVAPRLFKALGCDTTELFCDVDGNFPNHHPDPSQLQNLQDLIQAVRRSNADIGFAFDGDGDRLGVVTPDGSVIWPDRQMILYARDVLSRQPGARIIYDVKCSRNLPAQIAAAGGEPIMGRTGHSFMKAKMKECGAALAGEMSGHIFFRERWYGFDDGLYTGARLIELLSRQKAPPQEIFDALPDSINTPELRIEMEEGDHFKFMDEMIANAEFPGARISTIDGLRVDFTDGFGLVRPSNTTPILVLRFEADTEDALSRIQDQFKLLIKRTRREVVTPF